jgi:MFS family permease
LLKKIQDRNIWLVYASILVLGVGYGISLSLIAVHLDARGFAKTQIGSLAVWFALGLVSFSIPAGAILRRVSAKATLMVSLAGYAACVAVFPWLHSYQAIAAARVLDGAFSVGVWVSCETILLARAEQGMKAFVTSVYAMSLAIGYILGPIVARVIVLFAPNWIAFGTAGVLALGAAAIASGLDPDPAAAHRTADAAQAAGGEGALKLGALLGRIKTSCFATFAYGYFQASVVLFLPLFLGHDKHIEQGKTIIIPAFFAAGMLLFSNAAGRLGDRVGHLLVMRVLGAVGALMIAGFVWLDAWPLMCAAIFVAGATLASISPVSLALQGVVVDAGSYARANSVYNGLYALGMLVGPPVSSLLFQGLGGGAMLGHLAALWVAFVVFTLVFAKDDPAVGRARERAQAASLSASRAA